MDKDCTGRYCTQKVLTATCMYRPRNMKAIDFLILNEIFEYLIKILTVWFCKISVLQYFYKIQIDYLFIK